MRRIIRNNKAVSNVLGYVFSFGIIAVIANYGIWQTATVIEDGKNQAASLEALNIANQIADAVVDAVILSQSSPDAKYTKLLTLPKDLAGKEYNVSITNDEVVVRTHDGEIIERCPNFNTNELEFEIRGEVKGGEGGIAITYVPPDFIYRFDFGEPGSPVESGFMKVTEGSLFIPEKRDPIWWDETNANPDDEDGGLYAFDDSGNPYIFSDDFVTSGDWIYGGEGIYLNLNPDGDENDAIPQVGVDKGGLFAYDHHGEPYTFLDDGEDGPGGNPPNPKWEYKINKPNPLHAQNDEPINKDPDGNGIDAVPQNGDPGGLFALDDAGNPFTFKDTGETPWVYDTGGALPDDEIVSYNPFLTYDSKYRIPISIKVENAVDLRGVVIKIVVPLDNIDIATMVDLLGKYSTFFVYDPTPGTSGDEVELDHYINFMPNSYVLGDAVFLVKMPNIDAFNFPVPATEDIYLYYGGSNYHENDMGSVSIFFDDFDPDSGWDRTYSGEDSSGNPLNDNDIAYSIARDTYNFIYVVGSGTDLVGAGSGKDWWIKKFDVNGAERNLLDGWNVGGTDGEIVFDGSNGDDEALCVATRGTDVYVVGYTTNIGTGIDWCIKKYDEYGKEYGSVDLPSGSWPIFPYDHRGSEDKAVSVAVDGDSIYVAGYVTNVMGDKDWLIKKYRSDGLEYGIQIMMGACNWPQTFDGGDHDEALSVAVDSETNDVYVGGYGIDLDGGSGKDWLIKKFNSNGDDLWGNIIYYDSGAGDDIAYSVAIDTDNPNNEDEMYLYVAGSVPIDPTVKMWMIKKYDIDGNPLAGTGDVWPTDPTFGEGEPFSVVVEPYTNNDWAYYGRDILVTTDPDGDNTKGASPSSTHGGGLCTFDASGEPFLFKDDNRNWIYDGTDTWIHLDPDGKDLGGPIGNDADPAINNQPGYLVGWDESKPYLFQDTGDKRWIYDDSTESVAFDNPFDLGQAINIQNDQSGGLYAIDGNDRPYIFQDTINDLYFYVLGYSQVGTTKEWYINKMNPSGTIAWSETIEAGVDPGGIVRGLTIDSDNNIYIAGNGYDLDDEDGVDTGNDWLITKLKSNGDVPQSTCVNTSTWSIPYRWVRYFSNANKGRISAKFYSDYNIITKENEIPMPGPDEEYIAEMKVFFDSGISSVNHPGVFTGGMIILDDYDLTAEDHTIDNYLSNSSLITIDNRNTTGDSDPDFSYFDIDEYSSGILVADDPVEIKMPLLDSAVSTGEKLIVKSKIVQNTGTTVDITSYLYHPSTFVPFENSISFINGPYPEGKIGIKSFYPGTSSQFMNVEWIRVIKSTSVKPIVTAGAVESINYGWVWYDDFTNPTIEGVSYDRNEYNPFCTDPLYYDFINVPFLTKEGEDGDETQLSEFIIKELPEGNYYVSITVGDKDYTSPNDVIPIIPSTYTEKDYDLYVDIYTQTGNDLEGLGAEKFPKTSIGKFKRIYYTQSVKEDNTDLILRFSRGDQGLGNPPDCLAISSIMIERLEGAVQTSGGTYKIKSRMSIQLIVTSPLSL